MMMLGLKKVMACILITESAYSARASERAPHREGRIRRSGRGLCARETNAEADAQRSKN